MNYIFSGYGILITVKDGKYYLKTDSGGSVSWEITAEISEEDAQIAQKSELDAYKICIKYQHEFNKSNPEFYGE